MGLLAAIFLSFIPALLCAGIVYWIDRYEKEPVVLLGAVFFWGAVVAALGALVAQTLLGGAVHLATGSEELADLAGATLFAPLTEESVKGFAVLLVFLALRREFDSLLDGLVYAGMVALGFAATENVLYLYGAFTESGLEGMLGLFFLRIVLGLWDHPCYTSFIGIGLALSRLGRSAWVRWLAPPAGWTLAVLAHALHNILATGSAQLPGLGVLMFFVDWGGWLVIAVVIVVSIEREGRLLGLHLAEEVERGALTAAQYHTAVSIGAQLTARLRALASGRLGATRRFYQLCGELAHKKHQLCTVGDEGCNNRIIEGLRAEMVRLSPGAAE